MQRSKLIAFLIVGPILLSMAGYITFLLTGWKAGAIIGLGGLLTAVLVAVIALVANLGLGRKRDEKQAE